MMEYIERDDVFAIIEAWQEAMRQRRKRPLTPAYERYKCVCAMLDLEDIKDAIKALPAADVAPVVHARWELVNNGCGVCSHCHRLDRIDPIATHCRYCGAIMDLEEKTNDNI